MPNLVTQDMIRKWQFYLKINVRRRESVWPDWAIYWTMGNFLKPLETIYLPKPSTFLDNLCKGFKIHHFRATFIDIWQFFSGHTGENQVVKKVCWIKLFGVLKICRLSKGCKFRKPDKSNNLICKDEVVFWFDCDLGSVYN